MADERVERAAVWIDRRIIQLAKSTGALTGESTAEVVERLLAAPMRREWARVAGPVAVELGESGA